MSAITALTEALYLLGGMVPRSITSTGSRAYDPTVTIDFVSVADLIVFAKRDKAKVEVIDKTIPLGHIEHSALYDRPGRRMLLTARVFKHMPEWSDEK